jgi:hypothetical protein
MREVAQRLRVERSYALPEAPAQPVNATEWAGSD